MTFFTLPTNYSQYLHKKIFNLIYSSNGGFSWNDVYFMPVKLREFYWNELLATKQAEAESIEQIKNTSKSSSSTTRRR